MPEYSMLYVQFCCVKGLKPTLPISHTASAEIMVTKPAVQVSSLTKTQGPKNIPKQGFRVCKGILMLKPEQTNKKPKQN